MDGDGIGARVAAEVAARLADVPGDFNVGLLVADDLMGGGTNRYHYEFGFRFGADYSHTGDGPPNSRWVKDYWLTGVLWSSEAATERAVREAILTAAHRVAYMQRHGPARTLRDMLAQEGQVMARAGCSGPTLDAEDIDYTREVLIPYQGADDMRTCIECLFGDAASRTLGFTPTGLSPWAGLALALYDARPNEPWSATAEPGPRHGVPRRAGVRGGAAGELGRYASKTIRALALGRLAFHDVLTHSTKPKCFSRSCPRLDVPVVCPCAHDFAHQYPTGRQGRVFRHGMAAAARNCHIVCVEALG